MAKDTGNSEMFSYTRNWLDKQNLLSAKDAHDYPAPELWFLTDLQWEKSEKKN